MSGNPSIPYYPPTAYASGVRRVIALLIDLFITFTVFYVPFITVAWNVTPPEVKAMENSPKKTRLMIEAVGDLYKPLIWTGIGLMFAYQILLRKTPVGTVGYLVTGIKLVGPDGESPDWRTYGKRVVICLFAIFSLGLVYITCFNTKKHQAVHDQICGTWLIRRSAKPEGPGQLAYRTRLMGTYPLTLVDVEPLGTDHDDEISDDRA